MGVEDEVDVRRAADVVSWECRCKLGRAVGVGGLDSAVEGGVYVAGVGVAGAVEDGDDARVDTGGVAVCQS